MFQELNKEVFDQEDFCLYCFCGHRNRPFVSGG